ncbi:MAG: DUF5681 domain-containing protein [Silicimonas sp.]|jgi:hypothetical protein|uniref:DUF5681 domain-containing protein n=1 Tax=Roseitalea porphyridii TaxID=1852022 RepID=UPI0032EF8C4D
MSKDDDDDYEVGYGKPPKEHRFKPGQSGNESGRPKGARDLKTDLAEELEEKVTVTENGKRFQVTKRRLIIKGQVNKAAKGDTKAAEQTVRWHQMFVGSSAEDSGVRLSAAEDIKLINDFYKRRHGGLNAAINDAARATDDIDDAPANPDGKDSDDI